MNYDSIIEFIRTEVPDWEDDVVSRARFKAFSGQRSDWEQRYHFWKDLILKVARHFNILIVQPSQVKKEWFNRGGLTPLCIDHVLFLMCNEGEVIRRSDLADPASGRLSQILKQFILYMFKPSNEQEPFEDSFILTDFLKERASKVINQLSESSWTSSCIVTLKNFQAICGGSDEATAILSYLSGCGKAIYLSNRKNEVIEGVKVSLSSAAVRNATSLDYDILHLIWTTEKLQQQLNVIDQRHEKSRISAVASLKSGNKKTALRHARELKLASESRDKCASLLSRVEEILTVISNAESAKTVAEAIKTGARAMKENKISVEDVELCLEEIEERIESQKEIENILETSSIGIDDEDIEEEFRKLELEMEDNENPREAEASESAASLTEALTNLKIGDCKDEVFVHESTPPPVKEKKEPRSNTEAEPA